MMTTTDFLLIPAAYLLGSIPFGYLFTKQVAQKNILELGSGNIGSTNVRRIAGKKIALLTQLCDMLKGLLPVAVTLYLTNNLLPDIVSYTVYLVAFASILGHNCSIFLKLKGGKGVNTTLGASFLLAPLPVLLAVMVYFLVKWRFKYVSAGSIALALTLPAAELVIHTITPVFYYLLACSAFILLRHIPNIKRLANGTENLV